MRVKTDEKRHEIMAVARQVFREKGYAETSMAEISARLGGSKSTPYSYFPSKEELFVAVMLDIAARSAEAVLDELERVGDMRTGLARVVEKLVYQLCSPEMIDFRRMLIAEAGRSDLGKRVHEQGLAAYFRRMAEMFAAQMREGRLRQADSWQAALHLMGLCMGPPVQLVLEGAIERPSDQELAAAAAAAADVFLRAYASEAASPRKVRRATRRKPRRSAGRLAKA
jgi:AcrR family transcriptional regulator